MSLCECGCGGTTTDGRGLLRGHWTRTERGRTRMRQVNYRGARSNHGDGYLSVRVDGRDVLEHVAVVERVLGRKLPRGVEIHHVNGSKADNANTNLVVCPNAAYHRLLHCRQEALDACGHADWKRCWHCKQWDDPATMRITNKSGCAEHWPCGRIYRAAWAREQRRKHANP